MDPAIANIVHRERATVIQVHDEIDPATCGEHRAVIEPELGTGLDFLGGEPCGARVAPSSGRPPKDDPPDG